MPAPIIGEKDPYKLAHSLREVWQRLIGTAQLADGAVTTPKLADSAVTSAKIADGTIATADLADDAVTYAKLQNISAQFRALGRNSASAGDAEEVTLSQLLDWIGSAARGDILVRGASNWSRLAVGGNGTILSSNGTDPSWQAPAGPTPGLVLLNSGSVSNAAQLDIVLTSYTAYRALKFVLSSFIPATDDVQLWMRFSTDGGSTYDATGYRYALDGIHDNNASMNIFSQSANQIVIAGHTTATLAVSNTAAEGGVDAEVTLHNQTNTSRWTKARINSAAILGASSNVAEWNGSGVRATAQDTDAARFLFESGNIASGDWAVYGYA